MEQNKAVTLSSGRKITLQTWPMRPSLRHVDLVRAVIADLSKKLNINAQALESVEFTQLTLDQLLSAVEGICALDVDRVFQFIADGVTLSSDEVEALSFPEVVELAIAVGTFNLRPMKGLFVQMKSSRVKSTLQQRN